MAWFARSKKGSYQIGWREPDGKQRYKTFKRYEDARRFKSDVEGRIDRGTYLPLDSRKRPLGQYMDLVLGAGDLADSTLAVYSYRRSHTGLLEGKPIGDVSSADIRRVLGEMEQQGIGAPTRASVRKLLSKVFNAAVRDGVLVRNPVSSVPNPRSERREIQVYTPQEIMALADAITPSLRGAVLLSAYGGLRGGEVCGLRVQDVNFLAGTVSVVQAVRLVRGRAVLGPPKTKASRRTVNVPRFVIEALNVEGDANGRGLGSSSPVEDPGTLATSYPSTLLFPATHGGLNSSKSLGTAFRAALKKNGLDGTWHMLRHTSVALAIQQGAHPKTIQSRLGHETITTTLDVYGHLFEGMDADLAAKMEQYGDIGEGTVSRPMEWKKG